ncbi:glycosyltransferase [Streptomyces sp. Root369]|uniref:glycosyltransferase n=1 Tax=Streptomyces sp. Root369 TaxID=1736523 RepID=UPI00070D6597|nr:glycosyltransferase [Streptomyces sp. Root369]KQW09160.1 hypothetical protein ASD08_40195 [Streptomyces sp. Root369]
MLEAYALLHTEYPDVRLVIADGETLFDYRAHWETPVRRTRHRPGRPHTGPDDELPALVAAADAFAFPSFKEGFGLAAMEALVSGVPLVVRDLPVLHEVFGPPPASPPPRRIWPTSSAKPSPTTTRPCGPPAGNWSPATPGPRPRGGTWTSTAR